MKLREERDSGTVSSTDSARNYVSVSVQNPGTLPIITGRYRCKTKLCYMGAAVLAQMERHANGWSLLFTACWNEYAKQSYLGDVKPQWVPQPATVFCSWDCSVWFHCVFYSVPFFFWKTLSYTRQENLYSHCSTVSYAFARLLCVCIALKTCDVGCHLHEWWCPAPHCTRCQDAPVEIFLRRPTSDKLRL